MVKKKKQGPSGEGKKDTILLSRNQVLNNNTISENSVREQLSRAPAPTEKGKSGYPHEYDNKDQLFRTRTNSSTTNYYEYPVEQSGEGYNFDKKPKNDPGPYRGITNQNKTYKGTICHDGDESTRNPNAGYFHHCQESSFASAGDANDNEPGESDVLEDRQGVSNKMDCDEQEDAQKW